MDIEPLERRFRNWRRSRTQVQPPCLSEPFHPAADIRALRAFFSRERAGPEPVLSDTRALTGECDVSKRTVDFPIAIPDKMDRSTGWVYLQENVAFVARRLFR